MSNQTYQCPGESYTISRSVHLGRLANLYPKCRRCPHREDTGSLGRRVLQALARQPAPSDGLFDDEGVRGVYLNELNRTTARAIASGFTALLRQRQATRTGLSPTAGVGAGRSARLAIAAPTCTVAVARDDRPTSADLAAGAVEGLRFAGCDVIDLGVATSACLVFCLGHLEAHGGLFLTSEASQGARVAMRFWGDRAEPLTATSGLNELRQLVDTGTQRPTRSAGPYHRFRGSVPYLACLLKHFHAVRPLRIAVVCGSELMDQYVAELFESLPCARVGPAPGSAGRKPITSSAARGLLAEMVRQSEAHLGVFFEADGERAVFYDERGEEVPAERIAALLARRLLRERSAARVVLEENLPEAVRGRLVDWGASVTVAPARHVDMAAAMHAETAHFGAGLSGRYWFRDGVTTADALVALAGVLSALSWSDAPLSRLLENFG